MKLIRCRNCSEPIALLHRWLNCDCGASGGAYLPDGNRCIVAGQCDLYGISNRIFLGMRHEAWPYDESKLTKAGAPKVTRLPMNPGSWPQRASKSGKQESPRARPANLVAAPKTVEEHEGVVPAPI